MELPKQFDNITSRVIDDLKVTLRKGSKVSMAAASFSIYAFEALQKELKQIDELQFIFTSPTFNKEKSKKQKREFYIPKLNRERTLYGSDFEIKLRNKLSQKAIAKECADWIRQKVGSDTAKEKEHDWLAVPIILIVFAAFTLAGLVGMCKSCSDSHPSYDYYEAPRK